MVAPPMQVKEIQGIEEIPASVDLPTSIESISKDSLRSY
jgi:hypothetical protein